ncbi:MAG: biotin/lipoyl-containing protein, partial [Pseudomonadota bacterium]
MLVAEGDEVDEGQSVLLVESDKAAIEIPAPYSGKVSSIDVAKGDTAEVGDVLMTFATADDDADDADEDDADDEAEPVEAKREAGKADRAEDAEPEEAPDKGDRTDADRDDTADQGGRVAASPVARRLAAQRDVDLGEVEATG